MIQDLATVQDYEQMLARSQARPVFLLKHSTRCPISASRWREFQDFAGGEGRADFYRLLVVENRTLSIYVAEATGIRHQSPQVFLFSQCRLTWHQSHWAITADEMRAALESALA